MGKHIEFDSKGNPTFAVISNAIITSTPKNVLTTSEKGTVVNQPSTERKIDVGNYKVAPWFDPDNDYPNKVILPYLQKSPALRSAIDYKSKICLSQGFYAVNIVNTDVDGNEEVQVINDIYLNKFLRSPMIRRFALDAYLSMFSSGMAFPEVILTGDGKIFSSVVHKSKNCRLEKKDDKGVINNLLLLPDWATKDESQLQNVKILSNNTWDTEELIAKAKDLKKFCFPLGLGSAINTYYSEAPYDAARNSGALDTSIKIAEYLDKMFDNQMSIKYHIKIPYAYWDKRFPLEDYPTPEKKQERQVLIEKEISKIEESLTKAENAQKAIITHFNIGKDGKAEEKWEIDVIDDKFKNDQYLPHAASSNAEIFTSMSINPAVKGLAMSAGPYANNHGGSNIREAFLIDIALSWVDRQEVNDLIELFVALTFPKYEDVEIRTRTMVLTTLDTGSQSKMASM